MEKRQKPRSFAGEDHSHEESNKVKDTGEDENKDENKNKSLPRPGATTFIHSNLPSQASSRKSTLDRAPSRPKQPRQLESEQQRRLFINNKIWELGDLLPNIPTQARFDRSGNKKPLTKILILSKAIEFVEYATSNVAFMALFYQAMDTLDDNKDGDVDVDGNADTDMARRKSVSLERTMNKGGRKGKDVDMDMLTNSNMQDASTFGIALSPLDSETAASASSTPLLMDPGSSRREPTLDTISSPFQTHKTRIESLTPLSTTRWSIQPDQNLPMSKAIGNMAGIDRNDSMEDTHTRQGPGSSIYPLRSTSDTVHGQQQDSTMTTPTDFRPGQLPTQTAYHFGALVRHKRPLPGQSPGPPPLGTTLDSSLYQTLGGTSKKPSLLATRGYNFGSGSGSTMGAAEDLSIHTQSLDSPSRVPMPGSSYPLQAASAMTGEELGLFQPSMPIHGSGSLATVPIAIQLGTPGQAGLYPQQQQQQQPPPPHPPQQLQHLQLHSQHYQHQQHPQPQPSGQDHDRQQEQLYLLQLQQQYEIMRAQQSQQLLHTPNMYHSQPPFAHTHSLSLAQNASGMVMPSQGPLNQNPHQNPPMTPYPIALMEGELGGFELGELLDDVP